MLPSAQRAGALPRTERVSRAYTVALLLLGWAFAVCTLGVLASVLGLSPLASSGAAWAVLLTALVPAGWLGKQAGWPRVERTRQATETPRTRALTVLAWTLALVGLLATALSLLLALWLPVGAYDAIGYRLPAVVQWLDAGAVVWVAGDDPLRNGYPLALEVIEAVLFRAFNSAALVDCVAHLFLLAGAASLLGYARELGLSRALSALSAGLFLLVPMHLLNAPSGYADAAFAGALVTLLVCVARWVEATRPPRSLLHTLGIASGLTIALKPHGFAFAGIALAVALCLRGRGVGVRRATREVGAVLALAAPGLFFAVRNVVKTGNPIYPLELRVGRHVLLRGKSSLDAILTPDYNVPAQLSALPSWLRPLWVWLQPYGPATSFDDRLAGFGYVFVLLGLPALGWLCVRAYRLRKQQPGLSVLVGLTWLCWLLQPFSFWPRFTSWLWGAAALAIGLSLHALVESGRGRSALVLSSCLLMLALPEALYALHHVKRLDKLGLSLLHADALSALVGVSQVDRAFVQRELLGKSDVCRTAWRIGTDDANLDGVVAQLTPRPRLHVIMNAPFSQLLADTRAHGCDKLIVIGDNPLPARAPDSLRSRIERATAFGTVQLLPVSAEVIP